MRHQIRFYRPLCAPVLVRGPANHKYAILKLFRHSEWEAKANREMPEMIALEMHEFCYILLRILSRWKNVESAQCFFKVDLWMDVLLFSASHWKVDISSLLQNTTPIDILIIYQPPPLRQQHPSRPLPPHLPHQPLQPPPHHLPRLLQNPLLIRPIPIPKPLSLKNPPLPIRQYQLHLLQLSPLF